MADTQWTIVSDPNFTRPTIGRVKSYPWFGICIQVKQGRYSRGQLLNKVKRQFISYVENV
jgi:hypothetical protein